jgi:transposase
MGVESSEKLGQHRWVIERTIAWLFNYRRLTIRHERHANNFAAFLTLAATLVAFKKLPT